MNLFHKPFMLLWLGMCAFLVGIAPAHTQPHPPTLRIAVASSPKTPDPALASDAHGARLLQLTNPALLRLNDTFQPVGLVATTCTANPQHTQFTCTLPQGRRFHDETPLTAAELQGWFTFLQQTPRSPLAGSLAEVKNIHAPTSTTLVFHLKKPVFGFLNTLADIPLAPTPRHATLGGRRAGLGPYRMENPTTTGEVTLTSLTPTLPNLRFIPLADATTRLLKLKKNEVDVVLHDIAPEMATWATQQGWNVQTTPSSSYTYLALNFRNEHIANGHVRRALHMAINRPLIRQTLLGGMAAPASSLLPPAHPAAYEAPEPAFNPTAAADMLDELGLVGDANTPRFSLTLLTSTDALSQRVAQVLQHQLAQIGVQLTLQPLEWGAFFDRLKAGRFDMALASWTGLLQPDFLVQVFHSRKAPPHGLNRGRVQSDALDAALNAITQATTPQTALQAALQAQKMQAEVLPYLPLYRRHHIMVTRPDVGGCLLPMDGGYRGLVGCRR